MPVGRAADLAGELARRGTVPCDGKRPNLCVIIAWTEDGEMLAAAADIAQPGFYYPPMRDAPGGYQPLRRSILGVPVTSLVVDIMLRTEDLASRNRKAEAPEHV